MTIASLRSLLVIASLASLSGCARDLSSSMYTSESTLSFTLEGVVVSTRLVKIKENDRLIDNKNGMMIGAVAGGVAGGSFGGGWGKLGTGAAGALLGGLVGAAIEDKLGESQGIEYVVKVDVSKIKDTHYEGNAALRNVIAAARVNSGLVTVVQGADSPLANGQKAFVVFSDNRTRVIAAPY